MYPSLEEVKKIAASGEYRRIPVCRELGPIFLSGLSSHAGAESDGRGADHPADGGGPDRGKDAGG